MDTKTIEAVGTLNWGKFMVARFEGEEWTRRSAVDGGQLLRGRGHSTNCVFVLDLQTGEGALFEPHGSARADLNKHKIWVCPLYEPFLEWLYEQDLTDIDALPRKIELLDVPGEMYGYRRPGPEARTA